MESIEDTMSSIATTKPANMTIDPAADTPMPSASHPPDLFVSCRRRTDSARFGTSAAIVQSEASDDRTLTAKPTFSRLLFNRMSCGTYSTSMITVSIRYHHQYSLREARPLNVAYLFQNLRNALPNEHP